MIWQHSSHHNIKHHHQYETYGETDGAEITVLTVGGFWYQFFNHYVEHGASRKGEHVG